jgi:hypothetical protein
LIAPSPSSQALTPVMLALLVIEAVAMPKIMERRVSLFMAISSEIRSVLNP